MTPEQVTAWAATGESETLELKRSTGQRREATRALCAMLNHRGGRVIFGVEPDGRLLGQEVGDRTIEEVAQELCEIEDAGGCVTVRFRPSRYVPPQRVGHDLTERQQAVLGMVAARAEGAALRELNAALEEPPAEWELKKDLALLKQLGLIEPRGHGRGAVWILVKQGPGSPDQ